MYSLKIPHTEIQDTEIPITEIQDMFMPLSFLRYNIPEQRGNNVVSRVFKNIFK